MNNIRQFTCENFRNIKIDELEFRKVNILVGPNNSGKSNLIRALSFAANLLSTSLKDETLRLGGFDLMKRGSSRKPVKLDYVIELDGKNVEYSLEFKWSEESKEFFITNESIDNPDLNQRFNDKFNYFKRLYGKDKQPTAAFSSITQTGRSNKRLYAYVSSEETIFHQLEQLAIQNRDILDAEFFSETSYALINNMRRFLLSFQSYSSSGFDFQAIRSPANVKSREDTLKKDGSNFLSVYLYASEIDPHFENRYFNKMKALMHDLQEIKVHKPVSNKTWMEFKIDNKVYTFEEMSDGTVEASVLALLTSLPAKMKIGILAIDEPEVNLHPAWLKVLARWILLTESIDQIFLSTHSADFLDSFTEEYLFGNVQLFSYKGYEQTFLPVDQRTLHKELEEGWQLGDLYRVGDPSIGGWPW